MKQGRGAYYLVSTLGQGFRGGSHEKSMLDICLLRSAAQIKAGGSAGIEQGLKAETRRGGL